MFDNPKKELRRLEDALRELEETEEDAPAEEVYSSSSDFLLDQPWYEELLPEENPAVDFGRTVYADEEFDDSFAEAVPPKRCRARKLEKTQRKKEIKKAKKQNKRKKGIGGLVILALAEIAAILYLVRWWILWLT